MCYWCGEHLGWGFVIVILWLFPIGAIIIIIIVCFFFSLSIICYFTLAIYERGGRGIDSDYLLGYYYRVVAVKSTGI